MEPWTINFEMFKLILEKAEFSILIHYFLF